MSTRGDIKANFLSTLRSVKRGSTITLADGTTYRYLHTFGKVDGDIEPIDTVGQCMPAAYVTMGDSEENWQPSRMCKSEVSFVLTFYIHQDNKLDDYASEIWEDVLFACMQDITRGGYAVKCLLDKTLLNTESFAPYGIMEMFFTVTHFVQA